MSAELTENVSNAAVAVISRRPGLGEGMNVLDVACGHGRSATTAWSARGLQAGFHTAGGPGGGEPLTAEHGRMIVVAEL
ncbi:hypothetical protein [Amycolatopsis xylanica]|uniref:hypothetical protein n=1 Tax=Amycolatopsis xylanica TaxID=589385 RepID=UPI00115FEE3F|nr:hypothetical protein [Amycolatopsis xylanica]